MKKTIRIIAGTSVWSVLLFVALFIIVPGCSKRSLQTEERASDTGLLRNDSLVIFKDADGNISIKNTATGKVTIEKIKVDWMQTATNDSLAVFCAEDKRGFYNVYTGRIAINAQYRRAWIFSEGLAAVQRNGFIGFIDHSGDVVIDFNYPYHGNPLSEFVFKHGHCIVADTTGKCGVIDKVGNWVIEPIYDYVRTYENYAIVSKEGIRRQLSYDGTILNAFVLDHVEELAYEVQERYENRDGDIHYITKEMPTGLFKYQVGGKWGLMNEDCIRLTEPMYSHIYAINNKMFKAGLDYYSEIILNDKGEVMQ